MSVSNRRPRRKSLDVLDSRIAALQERADGLMTSHRQLVIQIKALQNVRALQVEQNAQRDNTQTNDVVSDIVTPEVSADSAVSDTVSV